MERAKNWPLLGAGVAAVVLLTLSAAWLSNRRSGAGDPVDSPGPGEVPASSSAPIAVGDRSVAVSTIFGGVIVSGDQNQVDARQTTMLAAPTPQAAEVRASGHVVRLPRPPSGISVGREAALSVLEKALQPGSGDAVGMAILGLGGIGKTELALHYVLAHSNAYELTWWITGESVDAVARGLAGLAKELNPDGTENWDSVDAAVWARAWLGSHSNWLLVLDNVDTPESIEEVIASAAVTGGRVLLTTRRDLAWVRYRLTTFRLKVLDRPASVALLYRFLPGHLDHEQAQQLAAELGDLPLAVEQAGAYLAQRPQVTIAEYRSRLVQQPARIFAAVAQGTPGDRAVAATWRITMETVWAENPLAGHLLTIASYLAPQRIPVDLLAEVADDPQAAEDAIALLGSYSMLTIDTGGTVAVHRVVQATTRSNETTDTAYRQALEIVSDRLPDDPRANVAGWAAWSELLPHLDALFEATPDDAREETLVQISNLLDKTGSYQWHQGQLKEAIVKLERAKSIDESISSHNIVNRLTSLNNLAIAYQSVGRMDDAIHLLQLTLALRENLIGGDHQHTLMSRTNLAAAYQAVGRLNEAVRLLEQNLIDSERVLGSSHLDTLITRNNLAAAYRAIGQVDRSAKLLERVLADSTRTLGSEHPDTLDARNNLAVVYESMGRLEDVIPLFEQTLADRERVLGEDNPMTIMTRGNLAEAYKSAGRLSDAMRLLKQTLTDRERVLGPDNPETLNSRRALAGGFKSRGQHNEAIRIYEYSLSSSERVLGREHPDTLTSMSDLACAYEAAGRILDASVLHKKTLDNRKHVLGNDNPDTLMSQNNLAYTYSLTGRLADATLLYEQTLASRERVLGSDHPETLSSRANLATAYHMAGRLDKSIPLLLRTLRDRQRILGVRHPDTLMSLNNLAYAFHLIGHSQDAISLYEGALAACEEFLDPAHPLTATVRGNLDTAREAAE